MAQAPAKRNPTTNAPASGEPTTPASRPTTAIDTSAKLSEEVLKTVERSQRVAIDAVRNFVNIVDQALPPLPHGEGPSRRQEIVDSALEMADRLVHTQYDFICKVIDSAAESLSRSDGTK